MKHMASTLSVALVIFLFALGFWLYDRKKKKNEKINTNISKLKQKKVHRVTLLNATYHDENIEQIKNWALENGGRIVEGTQGEHLVYFGQSGKSQFDGFLNIPIDQLPVRLLFLESNGQIKLRVDEDFGFQLFVGGVKQQFKLRYAERFERIEMAINEVLS